MDSHPPVPYAAIRHHGVIGDRRTAALVATDGTIDWFSLPDYDGNIIFGALLDAQKGGYWHLGPHIRRLGTQAYVEDTTSLVTSWDLHEGRLELTDVMPWPENHRPPGREPHRAILRRLRCVQGRAAAQLFLLIACDFKAIEPTTITEQTLSLRTGNHDIELWSSRPLRISSRGVEAAWRLEEGEEIRCVLTVNHRAAEWDEQKAEAARAETDRYWKQWVDKVSYDGPRRTQLRRSAILIHQLAYAPTGAHVAAVTTSLPERIGSSWNADYRLCWVRDTSLCLAVLTMLGHTEGAEQYMDWLGGLPSATNAPLQVVYGIHGQTELPQTKREDLDGYRSSKPVRFGNRAYQQNQHGSLGYLVDCVHIYLHGNGRWKPEYWQLVRRVADYLASQWQQRSNGIWELPSQQHYLSGLVMGWVGLDRAVKIANILGETEPIERWRSVRDAIYTEVMTRGWSEGLGAFRQHLEGDNLDADVLLIPLLGMLPVDHPRVQESVDRVMERLTIDGFVYRFDPLATPGTREEGIPLGQYEGAFLPCTFWLATILARMGRRAEAEAILERAEKIAGPVGLFAEGVDARSGDFLGNTPLLFSQIVYVRAIRALAGLTDPSHD
ncbi:MAG: glycoside hydrolase family 15 protein [Gemmataceae bacterium]